VIKLNDKVLEGLKICFKTAHMLKDQYPNEIMKINYDTILPHQAKNRKCHGKSMSNNYAWYTNVKPPRIIIKQKCLSDPIMLRTKIKRYYQMVIGS